MIESHKLILNYAEGSGLLPQPWGGRRCVIRQLAETLAAPLLHHAFSDIVKDMPEPRQKITEQNLENTDMYECLVDVIVDKLPIILAEAAHRSEARGAEYDGPLSGDGGNGGM